MAIPQFIQSLRNGFDLLFEQTNEAITWTSEFGWGRGDGTNDILNYFYGAQPTKSGNKINGFEALAISAFFGAARMIAEDIAKLPLDLFVLDANGNEIKINRQHPIYSVISLSPDGKRTAQEFWEVLIVWTLVWGNGYAIIDRDEDGNLRSLQLIKTTRVSLKKLHGIITYQVFKNTADDMSDGQPDEFSDMEMFHLRGIGDENTGWPIVNFGRESLGITLATQTLQANMFSNGMNLGGVLETEAKMEPAHRKGMASEYSAAYGGINNINKVAILDDGMTYKSHKIKATDAELLATRKFQIMEVARWFRIPGHKLGINDSSTLNNIEQENIKYLQETLSPWMTRIVKNIERKLLFFDPTIIAKYDTKELTMSDSETRAKFWKDLIETGQANPNAGAKAFGLPVHAAGEKYYISQNLQSVEEIEADLELKRLEVEAAQKALDAPDENTDHDDDNTDHDEDNTGHNDDDNNGDDDKKEKVENRFDLNQDILGSFQKLIMSNMQFSVSTEIKYYENLKKTEEKLGDDYVLDEDKEKKFLNRISEQYTSSIEPFLTHLQMAMPDKYVEKWVSYRADKWQDEKAMLMASDLIKHYLQITDLPQGVYTLESPDGSQAPFQIDEKGVVSAL